MCVFRFSLWSYPIWAHIPKRLIHKGTKSLTCLTKTRGVVHLNHPTIAPHLTSLQHPGGFSENAGGAAMCCVGFLWLCLYISIGSIWVNLELLDLRRLKFCNLLRPNCCPLRLAQRAVKIHYVDHAEVFLFWPCCRNCTVGGENDCQIPCKHQRIPHSLGSARLKILCQFSPAPGTNLARPENSVEQCGLV